MTMNFHASPPRSENFPAGELVLTNARIVLAEEVLAGSLVIENGRIGEVQPGRSFLSAATDLDGDYLIPGVVDLHTDNLERQVLPRPSARWPSRSALLAHDAQCAASGVTTVCDALCLGDLGFDKDRIRTFQEGVADLDDFAGTGLLKAEHFLHLRCELPAPDMLALLDPVVEHALVRIVSLMDHSPGVGQYADLDRYRAMRVREGMVGAAVERRILELQAQRARLLAPNRRALLARIAGLPLVLASHDDESEADIARNHADGIGISEFPVSMAAARAAKGLGIEVIAGAPNLVRGRSHSGNVAARDLVREGMVDAFASDYVPASMIEAAFLAADSAGLSLAQAIALITDNPARMARLEDRGRIAPGMRADLVRVRLHAATPVVREVWSAGRRVS
jgi:alpha-D-ribose 1-methylphosphonate 5-triphosphate diphosphatase